jgi:hypothetical protein
MSADKAWNVSFRKSNPGGVKSGGERPKSLHQMSVHRVSNREPNETKGIEAALQQHKSSIPKATLAPTIIVQIGKKRMQKGCQAKNNNLQQHNTEQRVITNSNSARVTMSTFVGKRQGQRVKAQIKSWSTFKRGQPRYLFLAKNEKGRRVWRCSKHLSALGQVFSIARGKSVQ